MASISASSSTPPFYAHPHIKPVLTTNRGRTLTVSHPICAGTILLIDAAYAIVPTPTLSGDLLCSRLSCSRRLPRDARGVSCPDRCFGHVAWCNEACRALDAPRHRFECAWLGQQGERMLAREGAYNFGTVWHVIRLLATRFSESNTNSNSTTKSDHEDERFLFGWDAVDACCSYLDLWPGSQLDLWKRLVDEYLQPGHVTLSDSPNTSAILALLCKEETNTFGLYPKRNGPERMMVDGGRGECYGFGLYPRAALMNHSCLPNVTHRPDETGRMIYTAARDMAAGEECFITYLDLCEYPDVESRRDLCETRFCFTCGCERCVEEDARKNREGLDCLPGGFLDSM